DLLRVDDDEQALGIARDLNDASSITQCCGDDIRMVFRLIITGYEPGKTQRGGRLYLLCPNSRGPFSHLVCSPCTAHSLIKSCHRGRRFRNTGTGWMWSSNG